jgi:hypothetical protein
MKHLWWIATSLSLAASVVHADGWQNVYDLHNKLAFRVSLARPTTIKDGWRWVWIYSADDQAAAFATNCQGQVALGDGNGYWGSIVNFPPDSVFSDMAKIVCR